MIDSLPTRTRTYQNHSLNSNHWDLYLPRPDDIVISTSYKSGTTWVQNIVLQLIFLGQPKPALAETSPWFDFRSGPIEERIEKLTAQTHRRFIKSHLPLDALPYYPQVKYIVVGRDARDVFMSWWNHYSNYTDTMYAFLNDPDGRVGDPLPPCPQDIHEYWTTWMNRGRFEWESEGYPHSGNLYHTQSWWNFRHLENILFVHFNDLLGNLMEEIRRIADYLKINLPDEALSTIAQSVTFAAVKQNRTMMGPTPAEAAQIIWKQGLDTFFFKGTNGRWKEVLTEAELLLYEQAKSRVLTPDCARWLEQGRLALR